MFEEPIKKHDLYQLDYINHAEMLILIFRKLRIKADSRNIIPPLMMRSHRNSERHTPLNLDKGKADESR
jgi:hypothetical protein